MGLHDARRSPKDGSRRLCRRPCGDHPLVPNWRNRTRHCRDIGAAIGNREVEVANGRSISYGMLSKLRGDLPCRLFFGEHPEHRVGRLLDRVHGCDRFRWFEADGDRLNLRCRRRLSCRPDDPRSTGSRKLRRTMISVLHGPNQDKQGRPQN
jgi:hypothetical protein